jgi:hypothetical protein
MHSLSSGTRRLLPFLAGLALVACTVGEDFYAPNPGGGDGSGGGGGDGSGGGGGGGAADAAPGEEDCEPAAAGPLESGNHNPGLSCITGGCHDGNTAGVPRWRAAGTVYSAINGGAAVAGATVIVTDANGAELKLITAQNGNFWTEQNLAFPLRVGASKCPDTQQMLGTVDQAGASCNRAGCHDAANRIHLP